MFECLKIVGLMVNHVALMFEVEILILNKVYKSDGIAYDDKQHAQNRENDHAYAEPIQRNIKTNIKGGDNA